LLTFGHAMKLDGTELRSPIDLLKARKETEAGHRALPAFRTGRRTG
jgi:hypothetical protein